MEGVDDDGGTGSALGARLDLADWRRRVAELYAAVRALAASDPLAAWDLWRGERERLYRAHPQSPVPPDRRDAFRARYWGYDPALRFEVVVEPARATVAAAFLALPGSGEDRPTFRRVGRVELSFPDRPRSLTLYALEGYAGGLLLPFRDRTNGRATYAAGRYVLDTAKGADLGPGHSPGSLVIDFNFAFHPSCAFDPRWACPLAGPEDVLDREVRAGERLR
jgi:uncharacterized protein (DUF1684 family)